MNHRSSKSILAAIALATMGAAHAATGIFGNYVAIDPDGPGAAGYTFYGGLQPGPNLLTPFAGLNLGSYTVGSVATIAGAEVLTWKNNGGDVTGANLMWAVDGNPLAPVAINWTANATFNDAASNTFTGNGDQKWAQLTNTSINFLQGATPGAHTLTVQFAINTNGGVQSSAAYTARFEVTPVPEPSAFVLMALGLSGLLVRRRFSRV